MPNTVKVYGKAQSRTALGIANAYLVINPDVTLEELNKAFPGDLNSANRCDTIFVDVNDAPKFVTFEGKSTYEMFFFEKEDEVLTLKNGQKVAMQQLWQKEDFDKLVEWVKQYNIEVVECKPIEGFQKGGFTLEYDADPEVVAAPVAAETESEPKAEEPKTEEPKTVEPKAEEEQAEKKKKKLWWLLLLILLIIIILIILLMRGCGCTRQQQPVAAEPAQVVEPVAADTVTPADTVEAIQKNFNAAQFEAAKATLTESSKLVLNDLAAMLEKHPNVKLRIVGHASSDGTAAFNQKLSEERAKVAADYLISIGVAADRIQTEGKGSSEPIDKENRERNRRTEFIVVE
ncbi:MAG: OmpA family protein [Salinivirgaceae bacterium]|nr:OmpA family protein [Salinivirgaceae bacterium]